MRFFAGPRGRPLLWGIFVTLWTVALLLPMPADEHLPPPLRGQGRFVFTKTVHIAGYAIMAALGGWLKLSFGGRLLLLFSMMAHAGVTEFIQLHVASRTGLLQDVLLDHLGVAAGLLLTWKWWSGPGRA